MLVDVKTISVLFYFFFVLSFIYTVRASFLISVSVCNLLAAIAQISHLFTFSKNTRY